MTFGIKLNDVHSSPKVRQLQKTCVSFGEECTKTVQFLSNQRVMDTQTESDALAKVGSVMENSRCREDKEVLVLTLEYSY